MNTSFESSNTQNGYGFQFCYDAIVDNKQAAIDLHGVIEKRSKIVFLTIVYAAGIVFKLVLAKLIFKKYFPVTSKPRIGLNWSRFAGRLRDFDSEIEIYDYYYSQFSLQQIELFKGVTLSSIFKLFLATKCSKLDQNSYRDNIFYKFACCAEFRMYQKLIHELQPQQVVVAGLNDRHTFYLSEICRQNSISYTLVQHGCLFAINNPKLCSVDEFVYCYEFSLPFLKHYISEVERVKLTYLPIQPKSLSMVTQEDGIPSIAFACMPTNPQANISLIDELLETINERYRIIVYPHPRESLNIYQKSYSKNDRVMISQDKYKNVELVVTRISTIGIDFDRIGLPVVFVNLERSNTDYLMTGRYQVVKDGAELRTYLMNEFATLVKGQ